MRSRQALHTYSELWKQWVMRPRAFSKLGSYPEPKLLAELAEGMSLVAEHVLSLGTAASQQTGPSAARAVVAIHAVAEEEAGKYLILLDVARCAREPAEYRVRQLKRCYDHLAKGIYSRMPDLRPATYGELIRYIDHLRQSHHLDGPDDVNWIFRNEVEAAREDRLYVDFVETDEGAGWMSPARFDAIGIHYPLAALRLVSSMHRAGFSSPEGLLAVADVWESFVPTGDTPWGEVASRTQVTLDQMEAIQGSLHQGDRVEIATEWTYPLHQATLERVKVDLDDLRGRQREWISRLYT